MAISKVVYKSSSSATPVVWMDVTGATAAASDITSPKTAMLKDGVVTTGTGSGGGGGTSGVLTFDFTKGLTDEETGAFTFKLTNATQDSSGLHITAANQYALLDYLDLHDNVVEVVVGDTDDKISGTTHGRFVMSSNSEGLIYRSNGSWQVYGGSWYSPISTLSDSDYFEGSTITFEYPSSGTTVSIYKDGTKIFDNVSFGTSSSACIRFGSDMQGFFDVTILKCIIYSAEAYALKILMGS